MESVEQFVGEAQEGTDDHELTVELVDGDSPAPDSAVTRSGDEEAAAGTRSDKEGEPGFRRHSTPEFGLSDAEKARIMADNLMSDEARYARWQGRRPPVSHLQPAVVWPPGETEAVPLFDVGSRVVVEMRTRLFSPAPDPTDPERAVRYPWLRTKVIRVDRIDDETGKCQGINEDHGMATRREYFRYNDPECCAVFLAPPVGTDPFDVSAILAERREQERKKAQLAAGLPGAPKKRGRGRPKGSLNRPKEVIQAEKEAHRKSVEERRNLRRARRGGQ